MPITGATPRACFEEFREHISGLVTKIVPTSAPMRLVGVSNGDKRTLQFQSPQTNDTAEIETSHGRVYLHIAQALIAVPEGPRTFRLRTREYWYKLYGTNPRSLGLNSPKTEAAVRWEYCSVKKPSKAHCRHHVQFGRVDSKALEVPFGSGKLDLNRVHLTTGWVLMEEVFRFLIHELDMRPPCGDSWPNVLHESEEKFFNEFTSRGTNPPAPPA